MKHSQNSNETLSKQLEQLPLQGFRVPLKSDKEGWAVFVEGMGGNRVRIHMTKNKK